MRSTVSQELQELRNHVKAMSLPPKNTATGQHASALKRALLAKIDAATAGTPPRGWQAKIEADIAELERFSLGTRRHLNAHDANVKVQLLEEHHIPEELHERITRVHLLPSTGGQRKAECIDLLRHPAMDKLSLSTLEPIWHIPKKTAEKHRTAARKLGLHPTSERTAASTAAAGQTGAQAVEDSSRTVLPEPSDPNSPISDPVAALTEAVETLSEKINWVVETLIDLRGHAKAVRELAIADAASEVTPEAPMEGIPPTETENREEPRFQAVLSEPEEKPPSAFPESPTVFLKTEFPAAQQPRCEHDTVEIITATEDGEPLYHLRCATCQRKGQGRVREKRAQNAHVRHVPLDEIRLARYGIEKWTTQAERAVKRQALSNRIAAGEFPSLNAMRTAMQAENSEADLGSYLQTVENLLTEINQIWLSEPGKHEVAFMGHCLDLFDSLHGTCYRKKRHTAVRDMAKNGHLADFYAFLYARLDDWEF